MIIKISIIFSMLTGIALNAQNLSQTVIATSGEHFQNGAASLSWTLGEPIINSLENGSLRLTQGFHQPYITVSSLNEVGSDNAIRLYPNPANARLNIDFPQSGEYSADLFDVLGRKLQTFKINGSHYEIDLRDFPAANYIIRCYNIDNKTISSFKIQKIR